VALTVGSLFAGIGGFDLAAERVGWEIKWQVEIDDYCTKVLEKHWPHVRRYPDIRDVHLRRIEHEWAGDCSDCLEPVDVLCGGFPCQDISNEGHRAGITGKRSGLWWEMSRIVSEIRPRYVVVENVSALLERGMGEVVGELAAVGYDSEWGVFRACAFGASHMRERLFLVAYPQSQRQPAGGIQRWTSQRRDESDHGDSVSVWQRPDQSGIRGIAYGVSNRAHRMRGLGNAIVPQVAEWIFRQIQVYEENLSKSLEPVFQQQDA
jgi:DNA (cytosine-5)-methyltransferase 1